MLSSIYESEVRVELPLRTSARAVPPWGPSLFPSSLQARKVFAFLSMGADRKANAFGAQRSGALERGDGRALESLAELGDALRRVGASNILNSTQIGVCQAASP